MVASLVLTPVPKSDIVFVSCLWAYAVVCSLFYAPGNAQTWSGIFPFRPVAQAPMRAMQDVHQFTSLTSGLVIPSSLIFLSRALRVKFASDSLRQAVAGQIFLQLAQYLTEGVGQWPACLAAPVWLSVCQFMSMWRLHRCVDWYLAAGGPMLFPRRANRYGFDMFRWLSTRHPGRVWMTAMTRMASVLCLSGTVFESAVLGPMVDCAAFTHPKFADHNNPPLHALWEQTHGGVTATTDKEE